MDLIQAKSLGILMVTRMAEGKMFGAWLAGDLLEAAEKRAGEAADGNQSKYVRALIERDVATNPATVLVLLAKQYQPAMAEKIGHALVQIEAVTGKQVDGRVVMARLLDAYAAALQDPDFKPEQAFKLVDIQQYQEWAAESEERMQDLAERVAAINKTPIAKPKKPPGKKKAKASAMDEKLAEVSRRAARVL